MYRIFISVLVPIDILYQHYTLGLEWHLYNNYFRNQLRDIAFSGHHDSSSCSIGEPSQCIEKSISDGGARV